MKMVNFKTLLSSCITGAVIGLSSSTFASHDWNDAIDDILASNFGTSAGFVVDGDVLIEQGDEYLMGDFGETTCVDFEVTVTKSRDTNPAGKGTAQTNTETEVVTYCQET